MMQKTNVLMMQPRRPPETPVGVVVVAMVARQFLGLNDAQIADLVEYLKSIPEEAGRVTPFGGPPDARTGNPPWADDR